MNEYGINESKVFKMKKSEQNIVKEKEEQKLKEGMKVIRE